MAYFHETWVGADHAIAFRLTKAFADSESEAVVSPQCQFFTYGLAAA